VVVQLLLASLILRLREIILGAKPKIKSLMLFKLHCQQDNARMVWISRNAWSQIKPQLDEGGWRDKLGNFWPDVIRIDIPVSRRGNVDPYFTFVGKEAIEALRKYLEIRGEPKPGELIWKKISSSSSVTRIMTLGARRVGVIPGEVGKSTSVRYGYNIHKMRHLARSLWHESGADISVAEFMMGHTIDKLGYDNIMTLSPSYAVKEFKKAEPFLSITAPPAATTEDVKQELSKRDQEIQQLQASVSELSLRQEYERFGRFAPLLDSTYEEWILKNPHYKRWLEVDPEKAKQFLNSALSDSQNEWLNMGVLHHYQTAKESLSEEGFVRQHGFKPKPAWNALSLEDRQRFITMTDIVTVGAARFHARAEEVDVDFMLANVTDPF
jgi:hypothetical protein